MPGQQIRKTAPIVRHKLPTTVRPNSAHEFAGTKQHYFENSLFRTGIFCNAINLLRVKNAADIKPDKRLQDIKCEKPGENPKPPQSTNAVYTTKDNVNVAIVCEHDDKTAAYRLCEQFGLDIDEGKKTVSFEKVGFKQTKSPANCSSRCCHS